MSPFSLIPSLEVSDTIVESYKIELSCVEHCCLFDHEALHACVCVRVHVAYLCATWRGDMPPSGLQMAVAFAGYLMAIQEMFKRIVDVVHVLVTSPVALAAVWCLFFRYGWHRPAICARPPRRGRPRCPGFARGRLACGAAPELLPR